MWSHFMVVTKVFSQDSPQVFFAQNLPDPGTLAEYFRSVVQSKVFGHQSEARQEQTAQ